MVIGTKSFVFPFFRNFGVVDLSGGSVGTLGKTDCRGNSAPWYANRVYLLRYS